MNPGTQPNAPATNPNTPDTGSLASPFAQQTEGGAFSAKSYSQNMFGDLLGTRPINITYSIPLSARFTGISPTTSNGNSAVFVNPNNPGSTLRFGPTPNGSSANLISQFSNSNLTYSQLTSGGVVTADREFARAALQTLLSNGQLTPQQIAQLDRLSPSDRATLLANRGAINQTVTQATKGLAIGNVNVANVDAIIQGNDILYTALLTGQTTINLPGSGGTVGRVKLSEDNSPIPRDRLIFNYDYFDNVPFNANGFQVSRFQFGAEKTFLNGRWSAEFRLPFAGTMNSTTTQGFETSNTELGNVRFALKRRWINNDWLTLATGLGVTLPTADDLVVKSQLGDELYRFKNTAVNVEPFIGALITPTDRLFSQVWSSVNFDASGSELRWNQNVFSGSGSARIYDLPTLAVDGQIGYWLFKPEPGRGFGLAPFVEMHWNYTIAQDILTKEVNKNTAGNGLNIQSIGAQELNLTAGFFARVNDRFNVGLAGTAPLLQRPDRTFDGQFGLRMNYYFGSTAGRYVSMY